MTLLKGFAMAHKAVQFSVGLDNSAGTLAQLCSTLRKAKVNIRAISVADTSDCGWARIVAEPAPKARSVLNKAGYTVCAQLVVVTELPDQPGSLEKIASRLAKAGVNVNYVYGTHAGDGASANLVLGVSDADIALAALSEEPPARRKR